MKKNILVTFVCILCMFTANSQQVQKIVQVEPQLSDIYNILDVMDINLFRFDLNSLLDQKYMMNIYVDEYKDNKKVERKYTINLGNNIESLDEIQEEHRDDFRKLKQIPKRKNEWNNIKELSVYVRKTNDSTSVFTISVPEVIRMNQPVKLYPVGENRRYFYRARPFAFGDVGTQDELDIPIILYGSGWVDKFNAIRFCGESKIDPQMKADILTESPHYYILGLELKIVK